MDDCELSVEEEIEFLEAMYEPEELNVQGDSAVVLACTLTRIHATLRVSVDPENYPTRKGPTFEVESIRGVSERQEKALVSNVESVIAENRPNNCLVQVLECAMETLREFDELGECSICLDSINFADGNPGATSSSTQVPEGFCGPSCLHPFHTSCLAAWWKQTENARLGAASTASDQQKRHGHLQSLKAQVTSQQNIHTDLVQQQKMLKETKADANAKLELLASGVELEPDNEGEKPPTKNSLTALAKSSARSLAVLDNKMSAVITKLKRLDAEFKVAETAAEKQQAAETHHGMACPVCRTEIPFSSLDGFLSVLIPEMDGGSGSGGGDGDDVCVGLPGAWKDEQSEMKTKGKAAMMASALASLDADVRDRIRQVQAGMETTLRARAEAAASEAAVLVGDVAALSLSDPPVAPRVSSSSSKSKSTDGTGALR